MSTTILGIDIGSTKVCAVIAKKDSYNMKILGVGNAKSEGIRKGVITNIDYASKSIREAVNEAKKVADTQFEKVIVSISGSQIKSVDSDGLVNIPNHEIGMRQISRAMEMANHNANIPQEYEKLHILPYNFIVDNQEFIEDPLGMNGGKLRVQAHIVAVPKSSLNNLKKALKSAGLEADNIVLSSYASSIATLTKDEKELGVVLIDLGGATCNMAVHSGNSIRHNTFLPIGSTNITSDLAMALHTPLSAAEKVKINFGSLDKNSTTDLIELPKAGEEDLTHEVSLDIARKVILARVDETLGILATSLENSKFKDKIGAGVVLTGGLAKLNGIRELTSAIFYNFPVRVAKPREMEGLFETLRDPSFSTAVGLAMYGSGHFTPYEVDSNNKLRYKSDEIESIKSNNNSKNGEDDNIENDLLFEDKEDVRLAKDNILSELANLEEKKDANLFKRFWNWFLTKTF